MARRSFYAIEVDGGVDQSDWRSKTASWNEVRVALHEFITYLDTELPVFSDGDAAKILYATLARGGKSLTTGKAILASQYVAVSPESGLRE
jgi:hypothetical protein